MLIDVLLCTCLMVSSAVISQEEKNGQETSQEPTLTNEQVLSNIQALLKSSYSQYNIQIHIYDGIVTLVGTVDSQEDKKSIEKHVSAMEGVRKVYNHLHVK
jgi:osmotically-inducible protein OsmY